LFTKIPDAGHTADLLDSGIIMVGLTGEIAVTLFLQ